jgi:hypothetical protein
MKSNQIEIDNCKSIIKKFLETYVDNDNDDVESTRKRLLYRIIHHFFADGVNSRFDTFYRRSAKMIVEIEELSSEYLIQEVKYFDYFMSNYARSYKKKSKSIIIDIMNLNELIIHESKD